MVDPIRPRFWSTPSAFVACLLLVCATAGSAAEPVPIVAGAQQESLNQLIEHAQWGAQWATASICKRAVRERQINALYERLAKIRDAYLRRFGEEAPDSLVIVEGNGCIGGFGRQIAFAQRNIEEAEAMLKQVR